LPNGVPILTYFANALHPKQKTPQLKKHDELFYSKTIIFEISKLVLSKLENVRFSKLCVENYNQ
jgi:hypothetical protein